MAKQTSLFGKVSGKLGAVVFSTSGGETISREYNPNVANPSTQEQVNQRARMKLMSQLSASLANVIVMPKSGLVSSRNKFTKKNFRYSYASDGVSQVSYENIQLTEGSSSLPAIVFERDSDTSVSSLKLSQSALNSVSRVCYIIYRKTQEGKLQFVISNIVQDAGVDGKFAWNIGQMIADNYVFYAYGMRDMNAKATAQYGDLQVTTANDLAKLVASRRISTSDYQFTETRGATTNDGSPIEPVPEGKVRVYVTANGPGEVTGAGLYDKGSNVTVIAVPNHDAEFVGWYKNGSNVKLTANETYTFVANEMTDLVAKFELEGI